MGGYRRRSVIHAEHLKLEKLSVLIAAVGLDEQPVFREVIRVRKLIVAVADRLPISILVEVFIPVELLPLTRVIKPLKPEGLGVTFVLTAPPYPKGIDPRRRRELVYEVDVRLLVPDDARRPCLAIECSGGPLVVVNIARGGRCAGSGQVHKVGRHIRRVCRARLRRGERTREKRRYEREHAARETRF